MRDNLPSEAEVSAVVRARNGERVIDIAKSSVPPVAHATISKRIMEMKGKRWATFDGDLLDRDERAELIQFEKALVARRNTEAQ